MRFHADLHIHSKYSRACSKDCDLEHLTWWARRKGITLVGTGDFTHPAWYDHLRENLVPAEPGLFRLRPDLDGAVTRTLPPSCAGEVRFLLSVEISTIYKRGERTRKVHHLLYAPDLDAAATINQRLARIGNLGADGRPILGLDSRHLLEITLEAGGYLVPAHIWTPWFAVLGSKSGFDAVEDCYQDLADHIFAVETGLSSDPAMNWRVSGLDRYRLVSNSDAHSPPMLGRETTLFDTDLDYFAVRRALETGEGFAGTVEFFPEEGKYHLDGHRKCDVRLEPADTRARDGRCPECGKPLTVGVLHRVEELADRPEGARPATAGEFHSLVPLPEIMSEILGVGPRSKKVLGEIATLTAALGPELAILQDVPVEDIEPHSAPLAEAVRRLRRGEVIRDAGYDGEYGTIRLFEPGELRRATLHTVPSLFDDALLDVEPAAPTRPQRTPAAPAPAEAVAERAEKPLAPEPPPAPTTRDGGNGSLLDGLDPDQRAAAETTTGPLLIIAGPGTGKTRTLTHRLAHLVTTGQAAPEHCLAITFTRRAAEEMSERLAALTDQARRVTVTTFHALGLRILREHHDRAGLTADFGVADDAQRLALLTELTGDERQGRRAATALSRPDPDPELAELRQRYTKALREQDLVDVDELVTLTVEILDADPHLVAAYRDRYRWISVDEYQDVDETQYRLLRLLAPPEGNITAIGDPDQAIYRFRGADVGFFLRFHQDYPGARTVQLTRNYRSTPTILAGALQAIAPTSLVPDRALVAAGHHPDNPPLGVHHAADEQAEASFVARTIDQLLGGSSFHSLDSGRADASHGDHELSFADIAVLYRTDSQARALLDALTRAGVPVQKRSHDRLADRPGVRHILRELTYRPGERGTTGERVVDRLRHAARAALALNPDRDAEAHAAEIHSALDLLGPLATRCGHDLDRFHTELATGAEVDTWDPNADLVSLLTLHAAKGLEFPVVFVVGCEDGLLPLRWPGAEADEEQVREERRLFFVGMTRAQRRLYLSHATRRTRHGSSQPTTPSPFLADLDPALCERIGDPAPRRRPRSQQLRLL
ncbi:TIGR00375 family protein [Streptoalloteichus tenebrarius]|uniref:DNA 3'-5' helicase n=1 Tax=Streptoalloteichus tenebrarius (strain ATCC 17920 / DSM 40477 / JCM 4838 / CBS 697.72 / NBRC 16177 / NCIMB 11028 / NRRL B-12390 / A12253. 1 / ISP 5477) TaxID=1933 RepID=A0ABT1HQ07_STRSD|nr:UvrD-helicase domain-containing protein [Streptoalloteichus tenebrarius]MCP2257597.1 TIGR00375 family protein [Streptoalloteichus tenebrarius]BFE98553.1 UvrD-helicase domain-containing protein [Streptoalloteichus tenebrarius]